MTPSWIDTIDRALAKDAAMQLKSFAGSAKGDKLKATLHAWAGTLLCAARAENETPFWVKARANRTSAKKSP